MANVVCKILVTEGPLAEPPKNHKSDAGAMVEFWGVVRRLEAGREIEGIEYEAHREMAAHQLKQIAEQASEKFGLKQVIVHHRIGFIAVGEPSLFLRVASPHRGDGFRASQWIVDELKKRVPIWKRPLFKNDVVGPTRRGDAGSRGNESKRGAERPGSPTPATAATPATV
jgi:molybdopterin synthase catalytic subunit